MPSAEIRAALQGLATGNGIAFRVGKTPKRKLHFV
jgi:hypothetical protein